MSERSYSDIVARLENRAETLAQTALNGRDNRLIKLLETAAQEIKTLRASLQPATPTAGEPVAWLAEYDGHQSVTVNRDTMCQWKDTLGRKITPLYPPTGGDAVAGDAKALREIVGWVDSWVSNPVGSYSVAALDGLFRLTRDRIAALRADVAGDVQAARASEPVAWRVKNHAGHWYSTTNRALAETWRTTEQLDVEALYPDLAQPSAVQEALEHARAYIDADVESMEPGWRSAKAIVELIDAALALTSTAGDSK